MKDIFTIRQIAEKVNREPVTVMARAGKVGATPFKFDIVNTGLKRYWYDSEQSEKIFKYYRELEENESPLKKKRKRQFFPEVIYVVRTTEIYESKMNYLP